MNIKIFIGKAAGVNSLKWYGKKKYREREYMKRIYDKTLKLLTLIEGYISGITLLFQPSLWRNVPTLPFCGIWCHMPPCFQWPPGALLFFVLPFCQTDEKGLPHFFDFIFVSF